MVFFNLKTASDFVSLATGSRTVWESFESFEETSTESLSLTTILNNIHMQLKKQTQLVMAMETEQNAKEITLEITKSQTRIEKNVVLHV